MPPKMNACNSIEGALTVFKCVWPLVDGTLDQPGTAMQTRPRPGANACTVSTRSGAVCVRGFVFLGVCCLFQIGAVLSSVSMRPLMNAFWSGSGQSTVYKKQLNFFRMRHFPFSFSGCNLVFLFCFFRTPGLVRFIFETGKYTSTVHTVHTLLLLLLFPVRFPTRWCDGAGGDSNHYRVPG